jgi:hypothetical protein
MIFDDSNLKIRDQNFKNNKIGYIQAFQELKKYKLKNEQSNSILLVLSNPVAKNRHKIINYDRILSFDATESDKLFSISFLNWCFLLNHYVLKRNINEIGKFRYMADILYEITFYGFSENEVIESGQAILQRRLEVRDKYSL